jgi:epoxide hydrolase-like predicted phosphatase
MAMDHDTVLDLVFGAYDEDTDHPWHCVERGELTIGEYRDAVRAAAVDHGWELDPMAILARLSSGGTGGGTIREDVVAVVREVRAGGRSTALVTNNALELRELWRPLLPLDELFDVVIDSSEVGVRKPDARIYQIALDRLGGVAPDGAVFLDDAPGNVEGARRVGLHAILVEPAYEPALAALTELLAR